MRRFEHGIAHDAEIAVTLVVCHYEDDVRSLLSGESKTCEAGEEGEEVFNGHEGFGVRAKGL